MLLEIVKEVPHFLQVGLVINEIFPQHSLHNILEIQQFALHIMQIGGYIIFIACPR